MSAELMSASDGLMCSLERPDGGEAGGKLRRIRLLAGGRQSQLGCSEWGYLGLNGAGRSVNGTDYDQVSTGQTSKTPFAFATSESKLSAVIRDSMMTAASFGIRPATSENAFTVP